jgi:hypothetical protein
MIGSTVSSYWIVAQLGGGMGIVYGAEDTLRRRSRAAGGGAAEALRCPFQRHGRR